MDNFEAESAQAPFAFSVPQEVVDEFLRSGSNTTDHRMKVAADFAKQLPTETIAQRLPRIYRGGFGMMYMGKPYSAWYDATGIRVASGKSARDVPNAQRIAWADAARRIGELLESGEFLGMMELAQTPVHERAMAAQGLWYMYHDMAEEGKGYFPSMKSIRGSSFPEETARLTEQLANPEFLSRLTAEAAQFAEDARENRNLLRFPFHNPEAVLNTLKELAFPRRGYDSLLVEVPKPDGFITEDEIDDILSSGGNMSGGKRRTSPPLPGSRPSSPAPFRCCPMPKPNCMDIQAVTERLQLLSGETAEQLTQWAPVIASAVRMVELRMFDGTDPADERLIHLAAVKALRMLEQSRWFQSGDDVTAFTAGDVTVQQSGQHKASALMLEDAEQACRGLLRDDAFAFLSV